MSLVQESRDYLVQAAADAAVQAQAAEDAAALEQMEEAQVEGTQQ